LIAWGLRDVIAESDLPAASECGCLDEECRHVQTHKHKRSDRPWQIDYAFAGKYIKARVEVVTAALDLGLSDHSPLQLTVG
jgi:hypothetical protein